MTVDQTAPLLEDERDRAPDVLPAGAAVGRYVVLELVGGGTGGAVYAAFDTHLSRKVALKLVHRDRTKRSGDTGRWGRVVREARALAQLDHPNVVTVHDVGDDGERAYLAMEFVDGTDLSRWLSEARDLRWRKRIEPLLAAGAGLVAAHERGIVHGDFKPANVLRGKDARVRVSDFGVALFDNTGTDTDPKADRTFDETRTHAGKLWGTPLYMAPELFGGRRPNAATDVYSFAATVYECLFGRAPAEGKTLDALALAKTERPTAPSDTDVPRRVRELVLSGLDPDEAARPRLKVLLRKLRVAARPRSRRLLPAAAVAAVGVVGAAWAGAFTEEACSGADRHLAGVWDAQRKAEVGAALRGTSIAGASEAEARVVATLDGFAEAWVDAHARACKATQLGEQSEALLDEKMACLDGRLSELDALVGVLGEADAAVASRAVSAAQQLPSVAVCEDAAGIKEAAWTPRIDQTLVHGRFVHEVSRARALKAAGQDVAGLEAARVALAAAQELDATPLVDDARFLVGVLLAGAGQYEEAAEVLSEAALTAAVNEHDITAAKASIANVQVLGGRLSRLPEAVTWAKHAAAAAERAGLPANSKVTLRTHLGEAYTGANKLEEAKVELSAGLAMAREELDPGHPATAGVLQALANVAQLEGRLDASLDLHREANAMLVEAYGPAHPTVGTSLDNIGNVLADLGRIDEAIETHEQAVAVLAIQGDDHPVYQVSLSNLAAALASAGRTEEAVEIFTEVAAVLARTVGPDHVNAAAVHVNISGMLGRLERYEESEHHAALALPALEKTLGPDHSFVSFALTNLGVARLLAGRPDEARAPLTRAVQIQKNQPVPPESRAEALFALARVNNDPELAKAARTFFAEAKSTEDLARVDAFLASR